MAEQLLEKQGYAGEFQLASFHPGYCFADTGIDDVENYTNRSPWPIIHILRESSISDGLANYQEPHSIYEKNIANCKAKGLNYFLTWFEQLKP